MHPKEGTQERDEGAPAPVLRLRGGGGGVSVTVQPRVQKDKWSLYWKESMSTKTDLLPACDLALGEGATPADLLAALAAAQGWQPVDRLLRLEGFEAPWERALFQGRELSLEAPLAEQGVSGPGAVVTTVRRVLVAEGWKIHGDNDESSSDEEEEGF